MRESLEITPRSFMKMRNRGSGRLSGRVVRNSDYLSAFGVALFGKRPCELSVPHSPVDRARDLPITP